jgi:hypothetical protein
VRGVPITPWSDDELRQLRRLAENGLSRSQIAKLLGRPKNSVDRQVQRLAIKTVDPRGPLVPGGKRQAARHRNPMATLAPLPSLGGKQ